MDTTRIRKTFKYPTEDDASQDSRDELDEEEQEQLISSLQSQSQSSNTLYMIIFTLLPVLISPLYIYYLLFVRATTLKLLNLLALTSLLASSFTMLFMTTVGVQETASAARTRLDKRQRQTARQTFSSNANSNNSLSGIVTRVLDRVDDIRLDLDVDGPLLKTLPILNGIICGLLCLSGWILKGKYRNSTSEMMWLYLLLPAAMFGMTTVARKTIADETKGLNELRGMKYTYKGA